MNARQLAPGWLASGCLLLVAGLSAWPVRAQSPGVSASASGPSAPATVPGGPASGPRSLASAPASAPATPASAPARAAPPGPGLPVPVAVLPQVPQTPSAAAPVPRPFASAVAAAASAAATGVGGISPQVTGLQASLAAADLAKSPASASREPAKAPVRRPAKSASKPAAPAPAPGAPAPAAAAAAAAASSPSAAESAAHERQLDAIRSALVESTVAAPVRVQSFGWIDSEGRLHEESQFTSDARVRGVRIPSYLEDLAAPPAPPRVTVDAQNLPTGVGTGASSDPAQCLARNGRWRQGAHLEVIAAPGPGGQVPPQAARLAQTLVAPLMVAARDSRRWTFLARPYQPGSSYERALLGRDADRADWLVRVVLLSRNSGQMEAELHLTPQGHVSEVRVLALPPLPLQVPPAVWAERLAEWLAALDRETACDPVWFAVQAEGGELRLREGQAHGLQPGDRLLLVRRQDLAGRLLDPGALRALALLQVGAGGGVLRWLAGPKPMAEAGAPAGGWVALPL